MFSPIGLEAWEVVAYAGILALGWLGITSTFSIALAWYVFGREEKVAHALPMAPSVNQAHPAVPTAARKPEMATATSSAA